MENNGRLKKKKMIKDRMYNDSDSVIIKEEIGILF